MFDGASNRGRTCQVELCSESSGCKHGYLQKRYQNLDTKKPKLPPVCACHAGGSEAQPPKKLNLNGYWFLDWSRHNSMNGNFANLYCLFHCHCVHRSLQHKLNSTAPIGCQRKQGYAQRQINASCFFKKIIKKTNILDMQLKLKEFIFVKNTEKTSVLHFVKFGFLQIRAKSM